MKTEISIGRLRSCFLPKRKVLSSDITNMSILKQMKRQLRGHSVKQPLSMGTSLEFWGLRAHTSQTASDFRSLPNLAGRSDSWLLKVHWFHLPPWVNQKECIMDVNFLFQVQRWKKRDRFTGRKKRNSANFFRIFKWLPLQHLTHFQRSLSHAEISFLWLDQATGS